MTFLAGDILTAQRINRLAPKPYYKQSTGNLAAGSTGVDVPGASITFTTETDGATVQCVWVVDYDLTGATTAVASARLLLDGVTSADAFAIFEAEVATDRGSVAQTHQYTVPVAGSHTIKMVGTVPANMIINQYTTLTLLVFEIV
jgi:hypothetical protein